ncbi:MAG: 3-octaprenyl-4-hydroxybenzoate decarboxylase, partial [Candidatus Asgardarchaeia archaeon]
MRFSYGLRGFIEELGERGMLIRVREEVDPRFEVAKRIVEYQKSLNRPILFENV